MNIEPFLTLSTGHLRLSTRTTLEKLAQNIAINPVGTYEWVASTPYGYFLYVDEAPENTSFPADLIECMKFARANDIAYLMFDCDARFMKELPYYDDGEVAIPYEESKVMA